MHYFYVWYVSERAAIPYVVTCNIVSDGCNYFHVQLLRCIYFAAKQDTMGSGWERFEFDKDAPLDDGEVEGKSYQYPFLDFIG